VSPSAARILAEIGREEAAFTATLSKGQKLLDDMLDKALAVAAAAAAAAGGSGAQQAVLAGADAFLLYDSFGFPLELTQVGGAGGLGCYVSGTCQHAQVVAVLPDAICHSAQPVGLTLVDLTSVRACCPAMPQHQ
jgi:hypothetical protein